MRQTEWVEPHAPHVMSIYGLEHFRQDPNATSFQFSIELEGSSFKGLSHITYDNEWKISGKLSCGVATRLNFKSSSFRGVAARLSLSANDKVVAELILLNRDPALNIPVARLDNMEDLAADWQMWANRFNLPLILIEPDGAEQMVSNRLGGVSIAPPKPRRANTQFVLRRPRFLKNRKTGVHSSTQKVEGREIFARL